MNKIIKVIFITILTFTLSYLIVDYGINDFNEIYHIKIDSNHEYFDNIMSSDYWYEVQKTSSTYSSIKIDDAYSSIKYDDTSNILDVKAQCFKNYSSANSFLKKLNNYKLDKTSQYYNLSNITVSNRIDPVLVSSLLSILCLGISLVFVRKNDNTIYDNKNIFAHPFSIKYWKCANSEMKKVKNLVLMSILLALQVIAHLITLPSGFGDLGISLGYLFLGINCMLFGPINALVIAFIGDNVGYLISPNGSYFFGYTINAMLAAFVYGICFYKTKFTFTKVLISRFIVNMFVNVILGTLWYAILAGLTVEQAMNSLIFINLPKNVFYLIPQSIALFVVIKYSMPIFCTNGYIDELVLENITIL